MLAPQASSLTLTEGARNAMKTTGKVVTAIFALLAFGASFLAVTVGLDVTQPASKTATTTVHFQVQSHDTTADIASRLQSLGLIRNAQVFRYYARYKGLDTKLERGSYDLKYSMTMDQIINALLNGVPSAVTVCIPPGLRVTEYPAYFGDHNLDSSDSCKSTLVPLFDPNAFMTAVKTGTLPDGTKAADAFWYVMPPQKNAAYALEGYLFADTYQMDTSWDTTAILRHLIATWGANLCPGPDAAHLYDYLHDQKQCKAHAITVKVGGKDTNIFTAMEQQFFTTDDRQALYDALTLSSIVVREAGQNPKDVPGIAAVYYNRYYVMQKDLNSTPLGDTIVSFDADPTVWYANDTDNPPKDGKWWQDPQKGSGKQVDPNNPYNTYTHNGLPPGPIAAPRMDDLLGVLQAPAPDQNANFYFYHNPCGKAFYAQTQDQQDANVQQHQNDKCS